MDSRKAGGCVVAVVLLGASAIAWSGIAYGGNEEVSEATGNTTSTEDPLAARMRALEERDAGYQAWRETVDDVGIDHAGMTTDGAQYIDNVIGVYLADGVSPEKAMSKIRKLTDAPATIAKSPNARLSEHGNFYIIKFSKSFDYADLSDLCSKIRKKGIVEYAALSPVFEGSFWNTAQSAGKAKGKSASDTPTMTEKDEDNPESAAV